MINLEKVNYQSASGSLLIQDMDLKINDGEFILITGESGSGKSTLFNVLNGLAPELYEGVVTGNGTIGHSNIPIEHFSDHVNQIGVVFQNPKTHFFTTDVFSELAFVMENNGYPPNDICNRVEEVLSFFKLESFKEASMFRLSGGQRQQVSIAAATMLKHRILLLDEPSSNLDFYAIQKLKEALLLLKRQGMTILVAEHRLAYLMDLADRVFVMKNGTIQDIYPVEQMLLLSESKRKAMGLRSLKKIQGYQQKLEVPDRNHSITIEIKNLICRYRYQSVNALEIPELTIDNKSITGIIGENGAGKSTLFDSIAGLIKPKKGQIRLNGVVMSRKQLLKQTFLVMQDVNLQLFFETVEKELLTHAENHDRYEEVCEKFQLTPLLMRHPHTLSGGEKQRVAIATAILSGKKILLFDEPTSGLDYKHMKEVSQLLKSLVSEELLMIVISHDEEFLQETCQRVIQLKKGSIL